MLNQSNIFNHLIMRLTLSTASTSSEGRLDIKAGGVWSRGVTAFFDIRVTHVNATSKRVKPTWKIFKEHEDEKKRYYLQRVLYVEHGSFTLLVFGTNGGMGEECDKFLRCFVDLLAKQQGETYAVIISWLRTPLSFEILRSVHMCVTDSRTPFRKRDEDILEDFRWNINLYFS